MKKYLFAGVAFLVVVLAIISGVYLFNSLDNQSVEKDAPVVVANDSVIIGVDPNYAPMEFRDAEGEIVGYDVDMIKATFSKMGEKYQLLPINWADKTELLNSGEIDLIWSGLSVNAERKNIYELSNSYLNASRIILVTKGSEILDKSGLAGKVVGVETGGASRKAIEKFSKSNSSGPVAEIKEAGGTPEMMVGLLRGELDAAIASNIVANYYVANNSEEFRVIEFEASEGVAVGAKKGSKDVIEKINRVLLELKNNGEQAKIHARWFGK